MTIMTSPGLCPALVATAGGDLTLLEQHLHTLHSVAGPHLQLARAGRYFTHYWVSTLAKHPE